MATAASQNERAVEEEGRQTSLWDYHARWAPEWFWERNHAYTTCDHYHRWREDVALLREPSLGAHRFSVA